MTPPGGHGAGFSPVVRVPDTRVAGTASIATTTTKFPNDTTVRLPGSMTAEKYAGECRATLRVSVTISTA